MKATKLIKNAIKNLYNLKENEYDVQIQGHMYGNNGESYDIAVIYHENYYYVVRAWQHGGMKIRSVRPEETLKEAFHKFLDLDE